jgi:2,4-diaminopentanoate dehydrogenase
MPYRVIHCGSGAMGKEALRGIIDHPDLELVGQFVWSPEKRGVDSGVLAGLEPCGVVATNDWQALYALNADCLCDFGRAMPGERERWLGHTLPLLERGTNVVNFSAFEFAHPPTAPADDCARIEVACASGNSSFFFTGIDPGWATTDLAVAALAAANRVDCVRVLELGWFGHYQSQSLREVFGFGIEPGVTPGMLRDGKLKALWAPTLHAIAEVLGAQIDDWETEFEVDTLDHDIEAGIGTVKAGTAVVLHFELRAMSGGKPIAIVEHVDKIHRSGGKDWKAPYAPVDLTYRLEVEGSPSFSVEFAAAPGDMGACCAMPVVNAIPAVCQAPAGLLSSLDVPRYWARNVRADARRPGR